MSKFVGEGEEDLAYVVLYIHSVLWNSQNIALPSLNQHSAGSCISYRCVSNE